MKLELDNLQVSSFQTADAAAALPAGGMSWPDVCTCIGICQPTEDLYCSGGCPPEYTVAVDAGY